MSQTFVKMVWGWVITFQKSLLLGRTGNQLKEDRRGQFATRDKEEERKEAVLLQQLLTLFISLALRVPVLLFVSLCFTVQFHGNAD